MSNVSLDNEEIQTYEEYAYLSHFYMTGNENREITRRILQAKKTVGSSPQWNLIRLRILVNRENTKLTTHRSLLYGQKCSGDV